MFGFDLISFIRTVGYVGLFGIIFAESGLLVGFFLPGDSLLFTAGFLASQGILNIWILMGLTFVAAVAGDSAGYWFGDKVGDKIFTKEESWIFKKDNIRKANEFFEKHGSKTIILARFVPIVRTFVPILAGVGTMRYRRFLIFNIIGGALWTLGVSLLGFFLGKVIPNIDKYLLPIILLIIIISVSPNIIHLIRARKKKV
ncbi:MAG: VTT domain-containing protein [Candidatus Portnoybacteria bacterium]|nr:VTT domain-containing protein [Candidatus Portnoybacteria bacterium]